MKLVAKNWDLWAVGSVAMICLFAFAPAILESAPPKKDAGDTPMPQSIHEFKANTIKGEEVDLKKYKGKVVLIVNTASKCGLTGQYEDLEALYKKHKDNNLVILGFPCNQFGGQEPGSSEDIASFCKINYGVSFPMFEKIEVNGKGTHPLYQFLKNEQGGIAGDKIKWNFTKFLVDANGKPVKRYAPTTKPMSIEDDIKKEVSKLPKS